MLWWKDGSPTGYGALADSLEHAVLGRPLNEHERQRVAREVGVN